MSELKTALRLLADGPESDRWERLQFVLTELAAQQETLLEVSRDNGKALDWLLKAHGHEEKEAAHG